MKKLCLILLCCLLVLAATGCKNEIEEQAAGTWSTSLEELTGDATTFTLTLHPSGECEGTLPVVYRYADGSEQVELISFEPASWEVLSYNRIGFSPAAEGQESIVIYGRMRDGLQLVTYASPQQPVFEMTWDRT